MKNIKFYKVLFILAGFYNIAWGLFSVFSPQWLFNFSGMSQMAHPQIFACLGMVVGLYGLIYFEVARRPTQGFVLAAVGLLGKVLGPIGWVGLYTQGIWPFKTIALILTNDLIWWIPFAFYLRHAFPYFRKEFTPHDHV